MWRGIRRPWYLAFALTWVVVNVLLQISGVAPTPAARYALVVALLAAGVVWLALHNRFGTASDRTDSSDSRDPPDR